jgi:hypothetical protein
VADCLDTALRLRDCDLTVCVDTAIAHLAGAMGLPVWVLVPFVADWRWGVAGSASAWYASARVWRQDSPGDWDGLLARVAAALESWRDGAEAGGVTCGVETESKPGRVAPGDGPDERMAMTDGGKGRWSLVLAVLLWNCMADVAAAKDLSWGRETRESRVQTVFSDGFAQVEETRVGVLPKGTCRLRLADVSSGIVPESAILRGDKLSVVEMSVRPPLTDPHGLLRSRSARPSRWCARTRGPATTRPRSRLF